MKEFEVTITETLQKSVVVEADSKEEAKRVAKMEYWDIADIIMVTETK